MQTHINILELSVVVRLVSRLVAQGKSLRVVVLVDSNVVRCAASKGRSSSKALSKALNRLAALSVLGGIYLVLGFAPTRLNPSDDPTRDVALRDPSPGFDLSAWGRRDLYALASLSKLRRPFSNWVRLCLLLLGPSLCHCADRSVFRVPAFPFGLSQLGCNVPPYQFQSVLDFDQTLGFPGEGPLSFLVGIGLRPPKCWWFLTVAHLCLCHGVLVPRNAGDLGRQQLRSGRPPLQSGRPVLGLTNQHRETFINQFESWLQGQGFSLDAMLENHFYEIDHLNRLLVYYGRCLYSAGRPYNHFAETINAIAARKPVIRRQLQEAWNLAFAWVREEPSTHHIAMPLQVLVSAITICLIWGWLDMAGMLALSWGALLRVGEFLQATRGDLLLPCDTNYTNPFALLALREPKTRFTAARHQSAKLDVPDLLRVVHLAFSRLHPSQKLWPKSGQTLRQRFKAVMMELGTGTEVKINGKSLDLGSLRGGGATWVLQVTEDSEFTRRRGRWVSQRVMECYIQEISAFQYLSAVSAAGRTKIFNLCDFFLTALNGAEQFWLAEIPTNVWYILWREQVTRI